MSPQALVLVGGRRTAVWPLVVGMGRDLRAAGYQVTVASLYPPSDEVVEVLGVGALVSLEPARWAPAGLPASRPLSPGPTPAPSPAPSRGAPVVRPTAAKPAASGPGALRRRARAAAATAKKHSKAFLEARGAWERVRGSTTVMQTAKAAEIVVAADPVMVRAAWEIGHQVAGPSVVLGPAGVTGALAERRPR